MKTPFPCFCLSTPPQKWWIYCARVGEYQVETLVCVHIIRIAAVGKWFRATWILLLLCNNKSQIVLFFLFCLFVSSIIIVCGWFVFSGNISKWQPLENIEQKKNSSFIYLLFFFKTVYRFLMLTNGVPSSSFFHRQRKKKIYLLISIHLSIERFWRTES